MAQSAADIQLAQRTWNRYQSAIKRGHQDYQIQAKLCERFYLGGGLQWSDEDKDTLEESGKPWLEENLIFSTVNTVLGYQTQSRMDIAYKPREVDDQDISDVLTKLSMFIVDQNQYPWKESQVFADGLIQQRGYFDIRMNFNDNINGDIDITTLDPLDVIPDPDSKSYDPDDWADVTVTSWMTVDDVKTMYGLGKWRDLQTAFVSNEADFGHGTMEEERNKFGTTNNYSSFYVDDSDVKHVRILDRQYWKLDNREFYLDPKTGDLTPTPDNLTSKQKKREASKLGLEIIKKLVKRIRWTVSTQHIVLHDDWSPYDHFTIVPYFPYFRRGKTIGLVDNLIKTQEKLNKVDSQILHIVNTTANSGWIIEENSLTNMDTEDLEQVGSQTGLIIEYKRGQEKPEKIEPNAIPQGLNTLAKESVDLIRLISGVSETFQGGKGPEVSGTAIQSRVHQSAIQLASPIDNLFRTRNMLASRILKLIRSYYTQERTFIITGPNEEGKSVQTPVTINQETPDGSTIINDVTAGKYDVVIADVPTQITFQNAQFAQAVELRKFGVQIPDDEMVRLSTLSRKNEIAKKLENSPSPEIQQAQTEQLRLQIEMLKGQVEEVENKSKAKYAETIKQIADVANLVAQNPSLSPLMDSLLQLVEKETDEEDENEAEGQQVQGENDMEEGMSDQSMGMQPPGLGEIE